MSRFTDREKLEVVEHFIEQWRPAGRTIEGERDTYLILKEIADDIRGRDPARANETSLKLERAVGNARRSKTGLGYNQGNLREIAEIVLGRWPTIREALDFYAKERS